MRVHFVGPAGLFPCSRQDDILSLRCAMASTAMSHFRAPLTRLLTRLLEAERVLQGWRDAHVSWAVARPLFLAHSAAEFPKETCLLWAVVEEEVVNLIPPALWGGGAQGRAGRSGAGSLVAAAASAFATGGGTVANAGTGVAGSSPEGVRTALLLPLCSGDGLLDRLVALCDMVASCLASLSGFLDSRCAIFPRLHLLPRALLLNLLCAVPALAPEHGDIAMEGAIGSGECPTPAPCLVPP